MTTPVEDLDGQGLADALVANHATLLTAEARELVLAAAWADLHPTQALAPRPVLPGMERPRRFGGHGTPEAGEFAAAELRRAHRPLPDIGLDPDRATPWTYATGTPSSGRDCRPGRCGPGRPARSPPAPAPPVSP